MLNQQEVLMYQEELSTKNITTKLHPALVQIGISYIIFSSFFLSNRFLEGFILINFFYEFLRRMRDKSPTNERLQRELLDKDYNASRQVRTYTNYGSRGPSPSPYQETTAPLDRESPLPHRRDYSGFLFCKENSRILSDELSF